MRTIKTKHIVEQLSRELGVSQEQVYDIIFTPFELQASNMRNEFNPKEGSLPALRIPNLGIFVVNDKQKEKLERKYGPIPDEE